MKIVAKNKSARYNYQILETYEAGIVLTGAEVKSTKNGNISLKEAYVTVREGEAFLVGAHISRYNFSVKETDPYRKRKLLLKKREILHIEREIKEAGLTIVPIMVYIKKGKIKLEIGIGRGKKKYDKREDKKMKEIERNIRRGEKARW